MKSPLEDRLQRCEFSMHSHDRLTKVYCFEDFELRPDRGVLCRGRVEMRIQPQVLTLLLYLVENRHRIISKDEMIEKLWEGRIVSDAVLNTRIRDVRRILGDDGKEQRFLRTFPKRGVQFVAQVTETEGSNCGTQSGAATGMSPAAPGTSAHSHVQKLVAITATGMALLILAGTYAFWGGHSLTDPEATIPDRPSIAILRFATDPSGDLKYLATGVAENLIADLSQFKELVVISRNTTFSLDPDAADPRSIGRELGVEFVARGSLRNTDQGIRVIAELVEAKTGAAVWTERFNRAVKEVFAIQDEISDAIAGRLLPEMVRARVKSIRRTPTEDLSAWDLFLQAKVHQAVFTRDGQERAISLASAALDRDPSLAAAHSLIAQAKGNLFFWSDRETDLRDEAISSAQQALKMDPNDPIAYAALGYVYRFTGNESRAIGNLQRAVTLNPNSALIRLQYAHTLDWFRYQSRALPQIEKAIRLSPRDPLLQNMLFYKAHILYHLREYESSLAAAGTMGGVVSSGPWELFYHLVRAAALAELDRNAEARAAIDAAIAINPSLTLTALRARFDRSKNHPKNRSLWLASLKKAGLPD
jgi:TolB-like protein/DNA-binding winged helix-turn-helix (wHTH) protein/Flp pilus assembly protein TadD